MAEEKDHVGGMISQASCRLDDLYAEVERLKIAAMCGDREAQVRLRTVLAGCGVQVRIIGLQSRNVAGESAAMRELAALMQKNAEDRVAREAHAGNGNGRFSYTTKPTVDERLEALERAVKR